MTNNSQLELKSEGAMINTIDKCRICGSKDLLTVMDLGNQALTGVFPRERSEKITTGPMSLVYCSNKDGCGLVQLKQSYDLAEMYGMNYGYRSGLNSGMVSHLKSKVRDILALDILEHGDLVIDIGSNDGTTLLAYPKEQYQLVGIDPTGSKFSEYYTENIKLITDFFSAAIVSNQLNDQKAKVITSFSMFYDLEDPVGFAKEIETILHNDGVWITEQSYLPSMLLSNSFDTICQEHLEFYTLKQMLWIADKAGLKILDVKFNDINGGSFSIVLAKVNSKYSINSSCIEEILLREKFLVLNTKAAMDDFKLRIENERALLLGFLLEAKKNGKQVAGLGASTKGNVLLQYYEINDQLLFAIGEVNDDKFGTFTPGSLIPIIPEAKILEGNPDYILILPWHFRPFFESQPKFKGRTLVFPLPKFEIVQL